MTNTLTTRSAGQDRPVSGDTIAREPMQASTPVQGEAVPPALEGRVRGWGRRWGRAVGYDLLLVPVGMQTMADAVVDDAASAAWRWRELGRLRSVGSTVRVRELWRSGVLSGKRAPNAGPAGGGAKSGVVFGLGLLGSLLGLLGWFLVWLAVMAVIRGPFWGFVEHGAVGPGTWGGPSRTGAWVVHGVVAVPAIVVFVVALRGIAGLVQALVRRLDGQAPRRWVLPATITVAIGGLMFFWSWWQQR